MNITRPRRCILILIHLLTYIGGAVSFSLFLYIFIYLLFSYGVYASHVTVMDLYRIGVGAAISHVVPHTYYKGSFPTSPLKDGAHSGFTVNVTVHMWAPAATEATVRDYYLCSSINVCTHYCVGFLWLLFYNRTIFVVVDS